MSDNLTVKPAEQLYEYNGPLKKVVRRYSTEWVPVDQIVCMTPATTSDENDECGWSTTPPASYIQESFANVPSIVESMKTEKTNLNLSVSAD